MQFKFFALLYILGRRVLSGKMDFPCFQEVEIRVHCSLTSYFLFGNSPIEWENEIGIFPVQLVFVYFFESF